MDLKALIAALLVSSGCGEQPSFTTSRGVEVYLEDHREFLTREQADEMEGYLAESLEVTGFARRSLEACLSLAVVRVVDSPYLCYGNRPCAGEQKGRMLYVADTGCPYTSAYLHEIAHWMQECVKQGYDPEHADAPVWQVVRGYPVRCDGVVVAPSNPTN